MANNGAKNLVGLMAALLMTLSFSACKTNDSSRVIEPQKMEAPYDFNKPHYSDPINKAISSELYLASTDYNVNKSIDYMVS